MMLRIAQTCLAPLAGLLAMPLAAQLPEHSAVVGTEIPPPPVTSNGTPGIFYVTLPTATQAGGVVTRVMGLPAQLTSTSLMGGVFSVLHRPSDGKLFAGEGGNNGRTLHVHILTMNGSTVQQPPQSVVAGTLSSTVFNVIGDLALFPDGRVLVAAGRSNAFVSGPMAASPVAILDTAVYPPVLAPITLSPAAFLPNEWVYAAVVSRDGHTAYLITNGSNVNPPANLYKLDVRTGSPTFGKVTPLHTWHAELVFKLSLDNAGTLHSAGFNKATASTTAYRIDPSVNPVAVTAVPVTPQNVNLAGPALEPATGRLLFASTNWAGTAGGAYANSLVLSDLAGNLTPLTTGPPGGWGIPYALDINRSIEPYGKPSPGVNSYSFVEFPNPGGVPCVPNPNFSLTVQSSATPDPINGAFIGVAPANTPFLGACLLVDLLQANVAVPLNFSATPPYQAALPLPIPNNAALLGASLYVQSVHIGAGGLATSDGTEFTIF